jgi:hypothetical protein
VTRRIAPLAALLLTVQVAAAQPLTRQLFDQPDDTTQRLVHVLYAVASDGTDRHLDTKGVIDAGARSINQWLGEQGGVRLRFDQFNGAVDTSYLVRASHRGGHSGASDNLVLAWFRSALTAAGFTSTTKTYVIYYDGLGPECGLAKRPSTVAVVFLQSCNDPQRWDMVPLHELLHDFGAVADSAPHITANGHVADDLNDLMASVVPANPRLDIDRQDYFGHGVAGRFDLATSAYVDAATAFPHRAVKRRSSRRPLRPVRQGGTASTVVVTPRPCLWQVQGGASWLTVSQTAGIGPASLTLTTARNASPIARQAVVTIGGIALTVTQAAGPELLTIIDSPKPESTVRGAFPLAGWMFDRSSQDGSSGVAAVNVWAYPDGGGAPVFIGAPTVGIARPDVAAYFSDARGAASGFAGTSAVLPPGSYTIVLFPLDRVSARFEAAATVHMHVAPIVSDPLMWVDAPTSGEVITGRIVTVVGWAVDRAAAAGPGVDQVHVWAYPADGSAPLLVGISTAPTLRPDVAAFVGRSSAAPCGFAVSGTLLPGSYQLVVFAHSTVTGTFNNVRVVPITVK